MESFGRRSLSPAFRVAILAGVQAAVELHLRSGSDVNATDEKGRTPLMLAATKGRQDICRLLLLEGADPTTRDHEGRDALAMAKSHGHMNLATLLENILFPPFTHTTKDDTSKNSDLKGEASIYASEPEQFSPRAVPSSQVVDASSAAPEEMGSFDSSGWHEEVEPPPPLDDRTHSDGAEYLERLLSRHKTIDHDEGWDDVEFSLPDLTDLAPRRSSWTPEYQQRAREFFLIGARDGRIRESWIDEHIGQPKTEDREELEIIRANLIRTLDELEVKIDDSMIAPDPFVSADEDDEEVFGDVAREAMSYLGRLQSTDMEPYFCYAKNLPKEQLRREDEFRLGGEIEQGMLEALVAATGSDAVLQKLRSDAQAILKGEKLVRWMLNVSDVEGQAEDLGDESGEAIDRGKVDDLVPDGQHVPEELVARLEGIMQDCLVVPIDRVSLSARLFFADLSGDYLKSLWSLASDQDPGGRTSARVLAGLNKSAKAKKRLVEANLKLVIWRARKYGGLPLMDKIQDGNIGLMKASEKFSHRRGARFSTYAVWWIRQAILRGVADTGRMIRLPVHVQERSRKIEKICNRIHAETGRERPSAEEIALLADMPAGHVQKMLDIPEDPSLMDNFLEQVALIADTEHQSPEDRVAEMELQVAMQKMLQELDPRQADILRRRFGIGYDEHTLEEVGQLYGVTRERIRQIETKALNGLRHPSRARQLIGFV